MISVLCLAKWQGGSFGGAHLPNQALVRWLPEHIEYLRAQPRTAWCDGWGQKTIYRRPLQISWGTSSRIIITVHGTVHAEREPNGSRSPSYAVHKSARIGNLCVLVVYARFGTLCPFSLKTRGGRYLCNERSSRIWQGDWICREGKSCGNLHGIHPRCLPVFWQDPTFSPDALDRCVFLTLLLIGDLNSRLDTLSVGPVLSKGFDSPWGHWDGLPALIAGIVNHYSDNLSNNGANWHFNDFRMMLNIQFFKVDQ